MNLLKDDLNKLFFKFLIPAISSAVAVAGYSLVDTIAIGQGVGADEVLMPYAKEYGAWIFAGLPSFVITAFLGAFIRSDGSPKYVMFSTLIGGAVNIVGD